MFVNETLKTHLESSSVVSIQSLVTAEWNMNMPDNIFKLGNYRYRPLGTDLKFKTLPVTFDKFDVGYTTVETTNAGKTTLLAINNKEYLFTGTKIHKTPYQVILPVTSTLGLGNIFTIHNSSAQEILIKTSGLNDIFSMPPSTSAQFVVKAITGTDASSWKSYFVLTEDVFGTNGYYTKATDADTLVDNGYTNSGSPQVFYSKKDKMKMLYSLEDCIKPFRPRSGINKPLYFQGRYIPSAGHNMSQRPRYYMPSRYDEFRYWTSYRTENNTEYGIANIKSNNQYYINDAVPFVVYKDPVPANRLVVKMQTNVGSVDNGTITVGSKTFPDPLYGTANQTTPVRWKIQYLNGDNWQDAKSFDSTSTREDGTAVIKSDGYVELQYGLIIPKEYRDNFIYAGTLASTTLLPNPSIDGYAFLVKTGSSRGVFHIWDGASQEYKTFIPSYGWSLAEDNVSNNTTFIKDLTSPDYFTGETDGANVYRDFQYVRGIRVVVETMNKFDSTFDLIEMSPRLVVDLSDKVLDFKITKALSDIGVTSLPVGQLLASTGEISLFDDDQAFNPNNTSSIIYKYLRKNTKFNFFEKIINVENKDYYVPLKSLYSEGFPQVDYSGGTLRINLRDMFFLLESSPAPRLMITEASLSYAITMILDYIGFSNYTFKRLNGETDPVIPYFFVAPDQNIAEVLNQLAVATQYAMFFDEYNNLVVMSKNYMMPGLNDRETDFILSGSNNQTDSGVVENASYGKLPNIMSIASEDKKIFNSGKINYTTRYIQRSFGSTKQATMVDNEKTWIYKPVLLWEVAGTEVTKSINELASKQSNYVLGAMPLNSDISINPPTVVNNALTNNTIDLGENVYWLTRYQGYLYSNGEVIKYDAAQFNVTAGFWYPKNSDGSIDYSKPQMVPSGKRVPIEVENEAAITVNKKIQAKEILEANRQSEIQKLYTVWRDSHVNGGSNVWISSNQEYQKYFSSLPFNGKIYPTGLIRIYAEPYYETTNGITKMKNGAVAAHGRAQFGTKISAHTAGIDSYWTDDANVRGCTMSSKYLFTTDPNPSVPNTEIGAAGINNTTAKQTTRNSIIKNFMATNYFTETEVNKLKSTQTGTIQSSALVMNGPAFKTTETPLDFVSYVYKPLNNAYKHFGTRMRIIGKIENNTTRSQTPIGSSSYYQVTGSLADQNISIGGGSGGLAVMLNPDTNIGYYFEIAALSESNIETYIKNDTTGNETAAVHNVLFYKIKKDSSSTGAVPVKLWGGLTKITVDDGSFTGQYRLTAEETPTVYDLSVEYQDIGKIRRFFLYINNKLVQVVDDEDPLPIYNNMALFTRGSSRCMFEHIYALSENYSQNTTFAVSETLASVFGDSNINANESFRKYAMSGIIQATYLSGISAQQPPKYNMYFEEFGSIMRECAYFDIKYDRAYPALYSQLSPTFNKVKGYVTSGYMADSYGAEFMIFNSTDKAIVLDETSGNYLRIQGITFTQDTTHQLTVDEFFSNRSSTSDPELSGTNVLYSPYKEAEKYNNIKMSRMIYGTNEFSIDSPYIQTDDYANDLMAWIIEKVMVPKRSVGLEIFSIPTLQLGDIVTINYKDENNVDLVASTSSRFVVYNIEYSRNENGPTMTVYVSEV